MLKMSTVFWEFGLNEDGRTVPVSSKWEGNSE